MGLRFSLESNILLPPPPALPTPAPPNPSGLYSDHVAELLLHARVLSPKCEVEYVALSEHEAEELCGDEFMMKLATCRAAAAAESLVAVKVSVCRGGLGAGSPSERSPPS